MGGFAAAVAETEEENMLKKTESRHGIVSVSMVNFF